MRVFVDSNIPMYVAGAEHPNRGPATRFLATAGDEGLRGWSAWTYRKRSNGSLLHIADSAPDPG